MPAKKKAAAKKQPTERAPALETPERDAATGRPREGREQEIAADDGTGPEPHEVNSSLESDRMQALLNDHRRMGSRPGEPTDQ